MTKPDTASLAVASRETCEWIRFYAEQLSTNAPLPGGVVAVADGAGLQHQVTFGYANLERGHPATSDHLFQIGSISKIFTSLLINQLADRGVLSLDEPMDSLLHWLDLGQGRAAPTVREVLSHMSGIVVGADAPPDALAQVWHLRDCEVGSRNGARFHYSNAGYMMLGLAASARTGRSLPDLIKTELLTPMGMHRALPAITYADRASIAVGYVPEHEDRPWVPGDRLAPAPWLESTSGDGNIAASAADLCRLATLLIRNGDLDGQPVCTPEAVQRMTTPTALGGEPTESFGELPPVEESRYGLGINVERVAGNKCLTHGGGMVGYSTFILVDLAAQIGIVVLTNSNGENLYAQLLARAAHAHLLAQVRGSAPVEFPDPDPRVRLPSSPGPPGQAALGLGTFKRSGSGAAQAELVMRAGHDGVVDVELAGVTGAVFRTLTGRYVTDHPSLRTFHLDLTQDAGVTRWTHGPDVWVPATLASPDPSGPSPDFPDDLQAALVGHYRTFSPWFPVFRIVWREGRLLLAAPGGVEAPASEEELVRVGPLTFRIGSDPWLPERLVAGPVVDGQAISVDLDGCVYSRTTTS